MYRPNRPRATVLFAVLAMLIAAGLAALPARAGCDRVRAVYGESASLGDVKAWVRAEGAQRVAGTPMGTYEYFGKNLAFWVALRRHPDGRICGRYGGRYFAPQRTFQSPVMLGNQLSNGAWQLRLAGKRGTARTGSGAMLLFDMEDLALSDGPVTYAGGQRFAVMRPISPLPADRGGRAHSIGDAPVGQSGHDR